MKNLVFILLIFVIQSCGQKQNQYGTINESDRNVNTPQTSSSENNNSQSGSKDSTVKKKNRKSLNPEPVRVNFHSGSTKTEINGFIEGYAHNLTYIFEAHKGQKILASVNPKSGSGNIRINQIINPEGKADGPFSNEMTYDLNESGDWKLIVGENMMSGEPWKGQFVLLIEIK